MREFSAYDFDFGDLVGLKVYSFDVLFLFGFFPK